MKLPPFKLEEFWKKYEFSAPHLLCCSDVETWTMKEILQLADPESKELWDSLSLGYTQSPGLPLLRNEIAKLYESMDPDQILTFAGAEEGIYCTMQALVKPQDHVIVIEPCYQSLLAIPQALGANCTQIVLDPKKQWQLDLDEVERAFQKETKLLILNYPHNPTASLLKKDVFEGLIQLANKRGTYIFCDEVYRYLEIDETKRLPCIADAYDRGISLNVLTKAFGLAGLRMGWIATKDLEFLHNVGSYKLYTSICNSGPSEILALMALRAKETILKRNRTILLKNLSILEDFMKRHDRILSWVYPQSGPMALLQLLLPISVETFTQDLVAKTGVLIMPGSCFDLPGNFFRIGFGKKNMPSVLDRFEQYLKTMDKIR